MPANSEPTHKPCQRPETCPLWQYVTVLCKFEVPSATADQLSCFLMHAYFCTAEVPVPRHIKPLRLLMSYIYMEHLFLMFLDHIKRRSTVGRTPPDEWSARRRDLYLTTHDTHNRQISMPPVGFKPKISAGERPAAAHLLRSWSRNIKNRCSISLYDISSLRVNKTHKPYSSFRRHTGLTTL